ncbi:MAG: NusG domain II-containing protein [Acetatifactor sp.]|nr:NusG domain II-containing protein [Acetatifactor sp.]
MRGLPPYRKNAFILTAMILCISFGSAGFLGLRLWDIRMDSSNGRSVPVADIYQDGSLLMSIPLTRDAEPYTFTVTGDTGGYNEILVTDGQIGILSASCPDKLCIHQGFQRTSLLPIVCLPNRLVIRVHEGESQIPPDAVVY